MGSLSSVTTTLDSAKTHASTSKDQLSILGKTMASLDAGIAVSTANRLGLPKVRDPINPAALEPWKKANLVSLEEAISETKAHEGCCGQDCEADYWRKAWKAQKDRADAQEKSAGQLKQSLEQSQTSMKSEKEKISKNEQRVTRLLKRLKEVNSQVKDCEGDKKKLVLERDQARQEHEDLKQTENNQTVLVSRLQTQVAEYKRLVATHTSEGSQVPDDQLRSRFNNIFNCIRNIAVKLTRGAGFEYKNLSNQTKSQVVAFIPNGQDIAKASSIDIVISIISQHLVSLSDPHNCFGWSDDEPVKSAIYLAHSLAANDDRISREWVEITRELLMATCGTDLEASDSTSIEDTAGQVRNTLSCATPWTKATDNDVRSVFTEANGFFRLLRSQRSTYQVRMLPILQGGECLTFDSEVMEETITSQHCVSGQPVGVSAFPGLYKLDEEMNECIIACPKVKVRQKPTFAERVEASLSEGSATSVFWSILTGEDL